MQELLGRLLEACLAIVTLLLEVLLDLSLISGELRLLLLLVWLTSFSSPTHELGLWSLLLLEDWSTAFSSTVDLSGCFGHH